MSLGKDLLYLIRQFCYEEKLHKTAHMLEQETGFFFDMDHFDEMVMSGEWDEAENYLSGFTSIENNQHSMKTFFELRKQKFYEALDKHDTMNALDILLKDLKVFASTNEQLYRELTSLLTLDDFREHPLLSSTYGDVISARRQMMDEIRPIIKENPLFLGKVEFPQVEKSRLRRLINQSLNWQHIQCPNPQVVPQIKTLFSDHKCLGDSNGQNASSFKGMSSSLSPSFCKPKAYLPELRTSVGALNLGNQKKLATILEDAEQSDTASQIISNMPLDKMVSRNHLSVENHNLKFIILDDFPKTVERCLEMSSSQTSMEFHPTEDSLILVGNIMGEVELWDIIAEVKLFSNAFMIWNREAISESFLNSLHTDQQISVNCVLWSPDGSTFGVAFSKNIVQLYACRVDINYIKKQLEIEAHSGSVNDLAFSLWNDQLLIITCGEDKLIQVWDSKSGSKQFTFEGHGASVYSLCPHINEDSHLLLSTSTNGEIKAWLFTNTEPIAEYDASGCSHMKMAYSDDGKRLFSCGTNEDGNPYILEWNQTGGYITRTYHGLCSKHAGGKVQFSTIRNRFLVTGDDHLIKVWDMDNVQPVTALDGDGGLPETPYVCFNKEGTLMATFAKDKKIKILANDDGHKSLQPSNLCTPDDSLGYLSDSLQKVSIRTSMESARFAVDPEPESFLVDESMKPQVHLTLNNVPNSQKCSKIIQVSDSHSLRLQSEVKTNKICRLTYTNAGNGILALAADGIHLLWKWSGYESNISDKANTSHAPRLWQPRSGLLMINHLSDDLNSDKVFSPCFALSKNDAYLITTSGKKVSLFNTMTFKELRSCLPSPPVATCMAFYPPDNNIVAIGMDDSTILIYNMRLGQERSRLIGHLKQITGLAFSSPLKVLVSSAVDNQIYVQVSKIQHLKTKSVSLQLPPGWLPLETISETNIQFHQDQKQFLAVHETQLAIYETIDLKRVNQWMIGEFCARLTNAIFSSDNELVYAIMRGGIVVILTAKDLCPRLEIDPSVYLPSTVSYGVYPNVVAAHPKKPNQFALGLSDGGVVILDPSGPQGNWIISPPSLKDDYDEEFEFCQHNVITN
ncbi:OLC1v1027973C2 [Oldenlandia corymbosa var. corymbosa]|uniref:OLC1v1027973C2 n=1 Tax=Oldenlandia corymbosa var. corymbosa TaxID=529605 RepID=A0AAV1CCG1_OLDCO|nr:OLC1v1027973C2 [Oldenlandia corymbosa var. corymbosa]